ncbi:MAG: hypothetical protein IJX69_00325 [Oscillospiraceae bacterium]|nr:hypothetical protein [Oscillospiraceae bacterium]
MISKEGAIRRFVRAYDIPVPRELVEEEYHLCVMDMKHKMVYGQMAGSHNMNPMEQAEALKESQEELMEVAYLSVKEDLVMKDVIAKGDFTVTPEELRQYAEAMAKRQNTTIEMVKRFFGEDFSLLAGDVKRQKAEDWIYQQVLQNS